ncbi:MAG: UDP-galactopyranose mutase [Candidatus Hadarchaeales archaeon]
MKATKVLIVGAGITGITLAECFASQGAKVVIIEKRDHIGGNCFDFVDEHGIFVHFYGPHIFHTHYREVWTYLSRFTEWVFYQHRVLGFIDGQLVPIPFNLNTLHKLFPQKMAERIERKLINTFGFGKRISILELKKTEDKDLRFLADFVYEKVFLNYSLKQWGLKPEDLDPSVTGRVPVVISRDDRYFQDPYQGIPKEGYMKMFEKMLKNKNIEVECNTDFTTVRNKIQYDLLFYTGPIDEFFDFKFGELSYRYVRMEFHTLPVESFQPAAVVNYPNDYDFTRITEFKKFMYTMAVPTTVIGLEYPGDNGFAAWPVLTMENKEKFCLYLNEAKKLEKDGIYFVGRLAEYRYYDMDDAVKRALDVFQEVIRRG